MISLREWQKKLKTEENIIVNASHPNEEDEMMPWPIGFSFKYKKAREILSLEELQVGEHPNLIMCGFAPGTDFRRRKDARVNRTNIMETLEPFVRNNMYDAVQYFSKLRHYKFVVSPEGNGVDCHRHYEALMAGCIPIVEHNDDIKRKYGNVPILYTHDYSEICHEYLTKKYEEMIDKEYDFSRLFLDFYDEETRKAIIYCSRFWTLRFYGEMWYDEKYGPYSTERPDRDLELPLDDEKIKCFSLAIPTMNRFDKYLKEYIPKYLKNKYIKEIVICDENGDDYDKIEKEFEEEFAKDEKDRKIKLYKNEYRLGGFKNKLKVMSLCSCDYIALIDSDNFVGEDYFEEAIKFGINKYSILLPCKTEGRCDMTALSYFNHVDKENWYPLMKTARSFPRLNDGNGIYPKTFSDILEKLLIDMEPHAADAFVINQLAVSMGFRLYFVPDMSYIHPTSEDSYWLTNEKISSEFMNNWNLGILNFVKN